MLTPPPQHLQLPLHHVENDSDVGNEALSETNAGAAIVRRIGNAQLSTSQRCSGT
jgi:hypothetical protein